MPLYYDLWRQTTSHGTPSTTVAHMALLTTSQQLTAKIRALFGSAVFGTAGGAKLRLYTADTTPFSGGGSATLNPRIPGTTAAATTAKHDGSAITPGTTLVQRLAIGLAQTGGQGGWCALEDGDSVVLKPNGGVAGNAEVHSVANGATVPLDVGIVVAEG